ncbi:hypothetical protein [Halobacterium jilantaiense]|uniref:Uncharacterized protein n=1 Tax=Halobacterium jilantaiense TaxID=355548 RepID=A0A1I0NPL5_9EURY|nr:hypothetical protein [Halobacterium jilantaiense]SEW03309.1 hypothetical protein SAMN04487945_1042 [Halobacterium jilantaiense]
MSVHIEFKEELEGLSSELNIWSLADIRMPTRVEINGDCVPPQGEMNRPGKYNDLYSIYIVIKKITEFLSSSEEVTRFLRARRPVDDELRFEKLDESRVRIDWGYHPHYEHTEVVGRDALASEVLATGREYIQFAREVVFPYGEANPDWAGEYGKIYQLDQDREFIDELEAVLDEFEAADTPE